MKSDFVRAFNEMLDEKQLPRDIIIKALETAMVSAYRKTVVVSSNQLVEAKLDIETGSFAIMVEKEVVDSVMDDRTEVLLEVAQKYEPEAQLGDLVIVESTPADFGRVAAQTARQVIQQRLRDAEKQEQIDHYGRQVGEIVSGIVQSMNKDSITIGLDKKAEGALLKRDMIRGERFRLHDRIRSLVVDVKDNSRGPMITLSRTHRDFLRRLLENEVPEIYHGIVEIRSITREPGERAKIAVCATQMGIDPVGACVGQRGVRIQAIVRELHDEKIDVIEWNPDPAIYISKAISPARVVGVYIGERNNATVVVPEDQLSLAIGRDGQNARLAAKLTGWRIDIKSILEAAADLLYFYDKGEETEQELDPSNIIPKTELFEGELDALEAVRTILAKRSDGRTLSGDETDTMNKFVDRIERRKVASIYESNVAECVENLRQQNISFEDVCAMPVAESGLPRYVNAILANSGLQNFNDLFLLMKRDPEQIYKIPGVSPKNMSEIGLLVRYMGELENPKPEATIEPAEELLAISIESELETTELEDLNALPIPEPNGEPIEEVSFDILFNSSRQQDPVLYYQEEETEITDENNPAKKSVAKKGKKKNVEVEYDPDKDMTLVHRKHKRGGDEEWGW